MPTTTRYARLHTLAAMPLSSPSQNAAAFPTLSDAAAVVGMAGVLFVVIGSATFSMGDIGLVVTPVFSFALPALFLAKFRGGNLSSSIGLSSLSLFSLFAAAWIACTLWYWNVHWIAPIGESLNRSQQAQEWTQRVAVDLRPFWQSLLLFALLPAVCEELLHRGIVTPALEKAFGSTVTIVGSALLFGLSHFSLARLLPTAVLGGMAAFLRLRSGSLWPCMLLHLFYNTSLLLAAHQNWGLPAQYALPSAILTGLGVAYFYHFSRDRSNMAQGETT